MKQEFQNASGIQIPRYRKSYYAFIGMCIAGIVIVTGLSIEKNSRTFFFFRFNSLEA